MSTHLASYLRRVLTDTIVTYMGIGSRAGLALLINVLVGRWLGPEQFGMYQFYLATMLLVSAFFADAFDVPLVRYYAKFHRVDRAEVQGIVGSAIALRLVVAVPVCLLGLALSAWLGGQFSDEYDYTFIIRAGIAAGFLYGFYSFFLALLQARSEFVLRSFLFPLINVLRAVTLPLLPVLGVLHISGLIWQQLLALAVSALASLWVVRRDIHEARVQRRQFHRLMHFSKWTAGGQFLFIMTTYLAVPLLAYLKDAETAGFYAAAASIVMVVEMLVGAVMTAQLPRFSSSENLAALRTHVRRSLFMYILIAILCAPLLLFGGALTERVYGEAFEPAASVFRILLMAALVNLFSLPLSQVFVAADKPHLAFWVYFSSTSAWLASALLLIPSLAADGAAWATLAARLIGAGTVALLLWRLLWAGNPVEVGRVQP